jgi:NADPH:quinone reductase-like Zn-dependent oxidoreductase
MRALRFDHFGGADVLHLANVETPTPKAGETLVRVHAAGLNPLDWKIRAGHLRWLPVGRPPRGLGCDFAGVVTATGGGAHARHVGERVFGSVSPFARDGAFADFVVAKHDQMAALPAGVSFTAAAALPIAGGTALEVLTDHAHVQAGQRVLITGAAGGVGHFAVMLARHLGAHVVAVCGPANVEFVRSLGAHEVIDYTREDFTRRGDRFELVFDAACASTFHAARRVLAPAGLYVSTAGTATAVASTIAGGLLGRLASRQRALAFALKTGAAQWVRLGLLAAQGTLRPHVGKTVALPDVPGALREMETGHGRGKVVALVADDGQGVN